MWQEMPVFLYFCYLLAVRATIQSNTEKDACGIYLAPSKNPDGPQNSIIAGSSYNIGDVIDSSHSLLITTKSLVDTQLFDYIYEADEIGYSYVLFGTLPQVNDDQNGNVEFHWENDSINNTSKNTIAISSINIGDELVTGFKRQSRYSCTDLNSSTCHQSYTEDELIQKGHCLSDLYLNTSSYPEAGLGVYSKRSYQPGDVVHISPVIILPKHTIYKISNASNSTLLNYCITNNQSDVALLPLGLGAMINHPLSPTLPNVEFSWHSWKNLDLLNENYSLNLTEIELSTTPLFNLQYTALREIHSGEEILMSYGDQWETEWIQFQASSSLAPLLLPIQTKIFPSTFNSLCIGRNLVECNIIRNDHKIAGNETLQRLQQQGKVLSDRMRGRVSSNDFNPQQRKRFNGEKYEKVEEGVCQNKKE